MESVVQRLKVWEREWNIQILYAADCGSRAWGFATEESDRDVRFLYRYETEEYLRLTPPPSAVTRREGEMDAVGWDVYKAGRVLVNSGITLWEWLNAPVVYLERSRLAAQLRELARSTYSLQKAGFQYISAARQHVEKNERTGGVGGEGVPVCAPFFVVPAMAGTKTNVATDPPRRTGGRSVAGGCDAPLDERDSHAVNRAGGNRPPGTCSD
jgi:hypothetical protein